MLPERIACVVAKFKDIRNLDIFSNIINMPKINIMVNFFLNICIETS